MNASFVTDNGDPISQSNGIDVDGSGFIAEPVVTSSESASDSGGTPLLYFLSTVWIVWILLFVAWIPLLVIRNRRVSRWRQSQLQQCNSTDSQNVGANLASQRDYKYQQHKEANSQSSILVLLIMGASIGLALSIFANLSCDFVELDKPMTLEWRSNGEQANSIIKQAGDAVTNDGESLQLEFYGVGLWALGLSSESDFLDGGDGYQDSCFNISSSGIWDMGWQFQLARAASVAASVLGGLSLLFLMTGCCNVSQRGYFHYLTLPFLLATILQSLTLFLLDTNYCTSLNDCELGLGAVSSITASFYWLFGTLTSMTPFPDIPETFGPSSSPTYIEESNAFPDIPETFAPSSSASHKEESDEQHPR